MLNAKSFAAMVDHTLLSPTATSSEIEQLCEDAIRFETKTVCVNPSWVTTAVDRLEASRVGVCSVVGFPLGADAAEAVAAAARIAIGEGAVEIDTVIPLGRLIQDDRTAVSRHLEIVRSACPNAVLKVIIESAVLSDFQIRIACELAVVAGADFVKTSTGFHSSGGATVDAVKLMRTSVGPAVEVKASGGIRSLADVSAMIDAGATRLGMSATAAVIDELG